MDSIEIYDIYDLWYIPSWWEKKTTWFVVAAFVFVVGFIFLVRFLKKRSAQKKLTIAQKALQRIAYLENQKNILSHQVLYATLTTTLKEFLCYYYGKRYASQTDNELLAAISINQQELPEDVRQNLMFIFSGVEMIKFANQKALVAKRDEDLMRSKNLIEKINFKNR